MWHNIFRHRRVVSPNTQGRAICLSYIIPSASNSAFYFIELFYYLYFKWYPIPGSPPRVLHPTSPLPLRGCSLLLLPQHPPSPGQQVSTGLSAPSFPLSPDKAFSPLLHMCYIRFVETIALCLDRVIFLGEYYYVSTDFWTGYIMLDNLE